MICSGLVTLWSQWIDFGPTSTLEKTAVFWQLMFCRWDDHIALGYLDCIDCMKWHKNVTVTRPVAENIAIGK